MIDAYEGLQFPKHATEKITPADSRQPAQNEGRERPLVADIGNVH